jgi:hypothetical protein
MLTFNNAINLETFRGDSVVLNFTIKDTYGVPIDITDWIFFLTLKAKIVRTDTDPLDDDAVLKKDITVHTDPVNGLTQIVLTHDETDILSNIYQYDVQYRNDDIVNTIMRGTFAFNDDVTRRNTV